MSDPVSSMDVEDVLSSIRRLVSEEAKTQAQGASDGRDQETASNPSDVEGTAPEAPHAAGPEKGRNAANFPPETTPLTPDHDQAQDTAQPESPAGQVSFRHQAAAAARREQAEKLVLTSAFRIRSMDELRQEEGPTEKPGSENRPERPHLRPVETPVAPPVETTDRIHRPSAPAQEQPRDDLRQQSSSGDFATDNAEKRSQPDGSASSSGSRSWPFQFAPEDTLFERAKSEMEGVNASVPDESVTAYTPSHIRTTEAIAENTESSTRLEGLRDRLQDIAADKPETDDRHDTDSARRSPTAEPSETIDYHPSDDDPRDEISLLDEDETVIDEEILRDMVSEMVRQELQGELGDRITRNVRKLVRREIQRALASREFE